MRQKGNPQVCVSAQRRFQHFADLAPAKDEPCWYSHALFTLDLLLTNLPAYWQTGQREPWLLSTNLPQAQDALRTYRLRMWIEEMFGGRKGPGVDIERTRLCHVYRLSRLALAVALWYLWLVREASRTIKAGLRHLVDRKERRDLSIFRIGMYMMDRLCALNAACTVHLVPYS